MKVIVIGPRGKMGKLITQVAAEERDDVGSRGWCCTGRQRLCRDRIWGWSH